MYWKLWQSAHPECRFINSTAAGLGFPGIKNQSLAQVMERHLSTSLDLHALLHTTFTQLYMTHLNA